MTSSSNDKVHPGDGMLASTRKLRSLEADQPRAVLISRSKGMRPGVPSLVLGVFWLSGCGYMQSVDPGSHGPAGGERSESSLSSQGGFSPAVISDLTALAYCYCRGVDLAGRGNLSAAADALRICFTESAEFNFSFPPAYAHWDFRVRGPEEFVQHVGSLYQQNGFVRTQHQATNIEIQKTGADTAIVRGHLSAVHAFTDERVYFATALFVDTIEQIDGRWMITGREENLTALALLPAFPATSD